MQIQYGLWKPYTRYTISTVEKGFSANNKTNSNRPTAISNLYDYVIRQQLFSSPCTVVSNVCSVCIKVLWDVRHRCRFSPSSSNETVNDLQHYFSTTTINDWSLQQNDTYTINRTIYADADQGTYRCTGTAFWWQLYWRSCVVEENQPVRLTSRRRYSWLRVAAKTTNRSV